MSVFSRPYVLRQTSFVRCLKPAISCKGSVVLKFILYRTREALFNHRVAYSGPIQVKMLSCFIVGLAWNFARARYLQIFYWSTKDSMISVSYKLLFLDTRNIALLAPVPYCVCVPSLCRHQEGYTVPVSVASWLGCLLILRAVRSLWLALKNVKNVKDSM